MSRFLESKHWGQEEYIKREAHIYRLEYWWEVEFWDGGELKETRKMVTGTTVHSLRYAEDAAENWCLGYIP
tara:strand:- start:69 stop:281 length:213 start_codon:yes stop_codon:yes gene_type:complete